LTSAPIGRQSCNPSALEGTQIQLHIVEGLNHEQVFDEIDKVFDMMLSFTLS
jgi:hypothetical protein